jgi:hypothetical protein
MASITNSPSESEEDMADGPQRVNAEPEGAAQRDPNQRTKTSTKTSDPDINSLTAAEWMEFAERQDRMIAAATAVWDAAQQLKHNLGFAGITEMTALPKNLPIRAQFLMLEKRIIRFESMHGELEARLGNVRPDLETRIENVRPAQLGAADMRLGVHESYAKSGRIVRGTSVHNIFRNTGRIAQCS